MKKQIRIDEDTHKALEAAGKQYGYSTQQTFDLLLDRVLGKDPAKSQS